jgi:hypothetical protein
MKKKLLILGLAFAAFTACQTNDEVGLNPGVTEISPSNLPASSQRFIDTNFSGEVVADAFKVTGEDNIVTYEAFMTNNTNLVFHEKSELMGFGNINSRMEMQNEMFDGGMQNMGMFGDGNMMGGGYGHGSGGMMGGGHGHGSGGMMCCGYDGMMGDGYNMFREHPEAMPDEMDINELPSSMINYINENYPDKEILMAFGIELEDEMVEYQVLIQDIGGMIFDKDGNYNDMIRRGMGHCEDYDEIAMEDVPAAVLEYIESNYPENDILRVRMGSKDNYQEIQVLLDDIGILVFDTDGKFIKLVERRRSHHGQ